MIEQFEYEGIWWLPDKPEKRVSGTLRYSPTGGAVLDLIGSFKELRDINQVLQLDIILGVSSDGKVITLYKCFEAESKLSSPGLLSTSFYANIVFVGWHFLKPEDLRFNTLSINYSHLEEWTGITGFTWRLQEEPKRYELGYEFPPVVESKVDHFKVSFDYHFEVSGHRLGEFNLKQTTFIKIEPENDLHFEEYQSILYHTQNFLSLATLRPVHPRIIKGTSEEAKRTRPEGEDRYQPIDIFREVAPTPVSTRRLTPYDMLFTFGDISERFETSFRNWFSKFDLLRPVYDLFFGTLYNPSMHLQQRFLNLVQAIESYHRRTMKNYELPKEEHRERTAAILDSCPDQYKKWLRDELVYSNEPSLRARLMETLQACSGLLDHSIQDRKSFINKVVTTRHYLTHYDARLKDKSAEGMELYHLTEKLRIVLEISFLKELGFSLDDIRNLISRNRRYQDALSIQ